MKVLPILMAISIGLLSSGCVHMVAAGALSAAAQHGQLANLRQRVKVLESKQPKPFKRYLHSLERPDS